MKLVIWGAGGHGKVVCEAAGACGFREIVFIDDAARGAHHGRPVLGGPEALAELRDRGFGQCVVAIGDNRARARCFRRACDAGVQPVILKHPSAEVSGTALIGHGTVILLGAIVNAAAKIGANCIINTGAVVEHDCTIGDHVHIACGAVLGGGVVVGDFVLIGLGAVVLPGVRIGEGAVVGAGAVVVDAVPPGETVVGVPARPLNRKG